MFPSGFASPAEHQPQQLPNTAGDRKQPGFKICSILTISFKTTPVLMYGIIWSWLKILNLQGYV